MVSVSIVIPTLNARGWLPALFTAFAAQALCPPAEIVIVESGSRDGTAQYAASRGARVVPVGRFTHGGARNLGVRESRGEFVVFLSQDACPAGPDWLHAMLAPFADPQVAGTFSRQVPRPTASPMEAFFLASHFPPGRPVTMRRAGEEDLSFQRNVFFSNVSAAVRRDVALRHPFDEALIMSEDQQFARDVLAAGLAVVYVPDSVVVHSHDYGLRQVFERYFDSVYSITKIFPDHDDAQSIRMGLRYLKDEAAMMVRSHPRRLPHYGAYVLARGLGVFFAHRAERLPRRWARAMSLHKEYWDHQR